MNSMLVARELAPSDGVVLIKEVSSVYGSGLPLVTPWNLRHRL